MTTAFHLTSQDDKLKLRKEYLDKYIYREYKETPLLDNFPSIVEIVAKSYNGDILRAALLLIYDVLILKEQSRKPPHYFHMSQFRDGLDVMNLLFDMINYIAGYTEKYTEEHRDNMEFD